MAEYYVETTAGGGGAGTIGDPFTLAESTLAPVTAGDTVHVKAGTYSTQQAATGAIMELTVAGVQASRIEYKGYTTAAGDFVEGQTPPVILDAGVSGLTNCIVSSLATSFLVFRGFDIRNATGAGFDAAAIGQINFIGCDVHDNGSHGLMLNDFVVVRSCRIYNNVGRGVRCDQYGTLKSNIFYSNTLSDIYNGSGLLTLIHNIFHTPIGDYMLRVDNKYSIIEGNLFDGTGSVGVSAMLQNSSGSSPAWVGNNIFMNLDIGIESTAGAPIYCRGFNLFVNTTTPYTICPLDDSDISSTTDPFTNSAAFDYTLLAGSEATNTGLDAGVL